MFDVASVIDNCDQVKSISIHKFKVVDQLLDLEINDLATVAAPCLKRIYRKKSPMDAKFHDGNCELRSELRRSLGEFSLFSNKRSKRRYIEVHLQYLSECYADAEGANRIAHIYQSAGFNQPAPTDTHWA